MTQIIPNGGSRTSEDLYVGQPNEIRVDQSNKELRVHDGATPGGERIPNIDTNDDKYQSKNDELNGFKFDPNLKGFLTRTAAGVYRLRTLRSDGNIVVNNANGKDGDPDLSLATTLTGDRELDGDVVITQVLQVNGGINADLAGDTTGTHTGKQTGDVDVRGHELDLDDGQIAMSKINGLAAAIASALMPVGTIVMWSGAVGSVPTHWALCDGSQGTPDLRGQFVVGVGADGDMHSTGGGATHTHVATVTAAGSHQHNINVDPFQLLEQHMPSHRHTNGATDNNNAGVFNHGTLPANPITGSGIASIADVLNRPEPGSEGVWEGYTSVTGGDTAHGHGASSESNGDHTHAINLQPGNNLPPYYGLAYIMKIS